VLQLADRPKQRGKHQNLTDLGWPLIACQSCNLVEDRACNHQDDDDRDPIEGEQGEYSALIRLITQ
jgi:hypothetical protein